MNREERLVEMSLVERQILLMTMPQHLDGAGRDPTTIARLIALPQQGFVQQKIRWTHDVPAASRDFLYFLRACLRSGDLSSGLRLARARVGLTYLGDWLTSVSVAPLLPYLGPDSELWLQIQRALAMIEPPVKRADQLAAFYRPGLAPEMYDWLRAEFERSAAEAKETTWRSFLRAVAASQDGTIGYVIEGSRRVGVDGELLTVIVERLPSLCRGTDLPEDAAMEELAALATGNVQIFVAAVDAFAGYADRAIALRGLSALEVVLPQIEPHPIAVLGTAALSHAFAAHSGIAEAETLARRCLDQIPPPFAEDYLEILYASSLVEAGVRIAMAAAPFPELWPEASRQARALVARVGGQVRYAEALVGFLRATPWITDVGQRLPWLEDVLAEVRKLAQAAVSKPIAGAADLGLRIKAGLSGESQQALLVRPLTQALTELLSVIDRVLADSGDVAPLKNILTTAMEIWTRVDDQSDQLLPFFKKTLPGLTGSSSLHVVVIALKVYIDLIARRRLVSNQAVDILEEALVAFAEHHGPDAVRSILPGCLDDVEQTWRVQSAKIDSLLAILLLRVVKRASLPALLPLFGDRLNAWRNRAQRKDQGYVTVQWAATLTAFGFTSEAEHMLRGLQGQHQAGAAVLNPTLRLLMADVLIDAGAGGEAAALLRNDFVDRVNLRDAAELERRMRVARALLRASGDLGARQLCITAARQYRDAAGRAASEVETILLNSCFGLRDQILTSQLTVLAGEELMSAARSDSALAARWYALLALAVNGEREAVQQLWPELDEWKTSHHLADVRDGILDILDAGLAGNDWGEPMARLRERLGAVEDRSAYQQGLRMVARLINAGPTHLRSDIAALTIAAARPLGQRPQLLDPFLRELCRQLSELDDKLLVEQTLTAMIGLLDLRADPAPDKSMHSAESILGNILDVVQQQSDPGRLAQLLKLVMRRAVHMNHEHYKAEIIAKAIAHGASRVAPEDVGALLLLAVDLSTRVADDDARLELLVAVARSVAAYPPPDLGGLVSAILQHLHVDQHPSPGELVAWTGVYQAFANTTEALAGVTALAQRIRAAAPPMKQARRLAGSSTCAKRRSRPSPSPSLRHYSPTWIASRQVILTS
jgi:hypothetical protein